MLSPRAFVPVNNAAMPIPAVASQQQLLYEVTDLGDYIDDEGGKHQQEMQGILDALSTQEVQEFMAEGGTLDNIMVKQSRTGVIYATSRARQFGCKGPGDPDWGNLGQGAPETAEIPDQPDRSGLKVDLNPEVNEYADTNGEKVFRQAVATYYNHFFRQGKKSQYTWQNVAITSGGRSGLCRLMATLTNVNCGYFTPDYTAYSQLLGAFDGIAPIAISKDQEGYASADYLKERRPI